MKVLNFGSLNMDYIYHVDSFVRPGETKSAKRMDKFFGGKGFNQSIAMARAGVDVYHAGNAGPESPLFAAELESSGAHSMFLAGGDGVCGHAIIQVDEVGQNCILLYHGANYSISHETVDHVLSKFSAGDIVLLQNEINATAYIIDEAARLGMKIALNPSPYDEAIAKLPLDKLEWLIVNEIEAQDLCGLSGVDEISQWFSRQYPMLKVIITLGKQGAVYIDGDKKIFHPSYAVNVVDTTGAGDVFTGYFLAGTAKLMPTELCLELAAKAAALSVTKSGAANSAPTLNEVLAAKLTKNNI